jgi:hypothetical protein
MGVAGFWPYLFNWVKGKMSFCDLILDREKEKKAISCIVK